jgi:hypothetical protein
MDHSDIFPCSDGPIAKVGAREHRRCVSALVVKPVRDSTASPSNLKRQVVVSLRENPGTPFAQPFIERLKGPPGFLFVDDANAEARVQAPMQCLDHRIDALLLKPVPLLNLAVQTVYRVAPECHVSVQQRHRLTPAEEVPEVGLELLAADAAGDPERGGAARYSGLDLRLHPSSPIAHQRHRLVAP